MHNEKLIDKIIIDHGIMESRNIAIAILLLCQKKDEETKNEKIAIQNQELLNSYKKGEFVKYIRKNKTNEHLFTIDKQYEIIDSKIIKSYYKNGFYDCEYTILDDFGNQKKYVTGRQGSFELVKKI